MGLFSRKAPMTKKEAQKAWRRGGNMTAREHRRMVEGLQQPDSRFKQAKKAANDAGLRW